MVNTVEAANTKTANTHSGGGIQGRCPLVPGPLIAKNFCGSILADCFVLTPHNNQLRHCQRNTHRSRRPSSLSLHFLLPAEDLRNNGSTISCVWNWWKYGLRTPTSVLSPLLQHHFKRTHKKRTLSPPPPPPTKNRLVMTHDFATESSVRFTSRLFIRVPVCAHGCTFTWPCT